MHTDRNDDNIFFFGGGGEAGLMHPTVYDINCPQNAGNSLLKMFPEGPL